MKLNIAIVGCGKAAQRHLKIYQALKDRVNVVSVADVNPQKAFSFAEEVSAKAYTDYLEMLKKEDIDIVDLCVPSGLHASLGKRIIAEGKKHLLIEKPITLRLDEAEELLEEAERAGIKVITIFQNRTNLPVRKAKEAIEKGLLGRLVLVSARFYWSRGQSYYDSAGWRGTWALDGGALAQQGCHFVDMLYYLGGRVKSVFARMGTYLVDIEAEDLLVGTLHYENGALGTIEATTCARPKDIKAELTILGEKGSIILSGFAMNKLEHLKVEGEIDEEAFVKGFEKNPDHPLGFSHFTYLSSAVDYFLEGKKAPWLVEGKEALHSLEIIVGLYESAERGEEVSFPFVPEKCKLGRGVEQ